MIMFQAFAVAFGAAVPVTAVVAVAVVAAAVVAAAVYGAAASTTIAVAAGNSCDHIL